MAYEKILIKLGLIFSSVWGFALFHLGGGDKLLYALGSLMVVDFALGLMKGALGRSDKSKSGKLNSEAGRKGIFKKVAMLLAVFVGCVIDKATGVGYFRDGVIFAFCAIELVSIIENLNCLGVPIPNILNKAVELLNCKSDKGDKK